MNQQSFIPERFQSPPAHVEDTNKIQATMRIDKEGNILIGDISRYEHRYVESVFGRTHYDQMGDILYQSPAWFAFAKFQSAHFWTDQQEKKKWKEVEVPINIADAILDSLAVGQNLNSIRNIILNQLNQGVDYHDWDAKEKNKQLTEGLIADSEVALKKIIKAGLQNKTYKRKKEVEEVELIEVKRGVIEFEDLRLNIHESCTHIIKELLPFFESLRDKIQTLRRWRRDGISEEERDYIPKADYQPFDHQWVMYKTHTLLDHSADLSQMGTGKTLSCLMAIDKRIEEGKVRKGAILIIAPTATLESAWKRQIEKFMPHLSCQIINGSFVARTDMVMTKPEDRQDISLINYEAFAMENKVKRETTQEDYEQNRMLPEEQREEIVKLRDKYIKTIRIPFPRIVKKLSEWDFVILDECHKIKNPDAKRTPRLIDAFSSVPYKLIMSGTINANKLVDVHMPFVFLNRARHFNTIQYERGSGKPLTHGDLHGDFASSYFIRDGYNYKPRSGVIEELREKMEMCSVRYEKQECLSLPPKMYVTEELEMSPKQLELYQKLQAALIVELDDIAKKGGVVTAVNILAKFTKLAEAANGWIYNTAGEAIDLPWNPKLDAVKEIVSDIDLDQQKIVIWSRFTHDLHLIAQSLREEYGQDAVVVIHGGGLCKECGSNQAERHEHVTQFNDMNSPVKVCVANQATGGHGIDLTAASYEIFYSNSFVKTDRIQAEDRCHRIGMQESLTIIDLMCKQSIDYYIMAALQSHKAMTTALLEHLGFDQNFFDDDGDKPDEAVIDAAFVPSASPSPKPPPNEEPNEEPDESLPDLSKPPAERQQEMIMQKQGTHECLLASCAMIASKTIEEARIAWNQLSDGKPWVGSHTDSMELLKHWNINLKRVWGLPNSTDDHVMGILRVAPKQRGVPGHAVAFIGNKVYDPLYEEPKERREWFATNVIERGLGLTDIYVKAG